MAYEVVVPRLGLTMEEATIVEWYKQDGEEIKVGEPMYSVETDKTVMDVEAPFSGVFFRKPDVPGGPLPIGYVIAYILEPGESPPQDVSSSMALAEEPQGTIPSPSSRHVEAAVSTSQPAAGRKLSSPAARRRAREMGIDWYTIERPDGRPVLLAHVEQAAQSIRLGDFKATPLARRVAQATGVDLGTLAAKKPEATIRRADVESYAAEQVATQKLAPAAGKVVQITQVRRIISERMAESAQTTAPVTLTSEADATELVGLRERIKSARVPLGLNLPTYTDLMVKLTCLALLQHPGANASLLGEGIQLHQAVRMGVAVDTDAGLLVPVVRDVQIKTIYQISDEVRILVEKAHNRQLIPDELQGGTFTITNLGMYGIDAFTPIINLPQCAILGIGRIILKPWVFEGAVVPRQMMALSLTFDHRVIDGGPAARFLNTIRQFVEQPHVWFGE